MPSEHEVEVAESWQDPEVQDRRRQRMRRQSEQGLQHPADLAELNLGPTGEPLEDWRQGRTDRFRPRAR